MKNYLILMPILIGVFLATSGLYFGITDRHTDFEEAALGELTQVLFAYAGKYPIHCQDERDASSCIEGFRKSNVKQAVLWLGNSQVHAVNQLKKGEENAPPILHRLLKKHGMYLLTFSQPNANLQEHYILFEYLKRKVPIKILILPVVFDDLRNYGIRSTMDYILKEPDIVRAIKKTKVGQTILNIHDGVPNINGNGKVQTTFQDRVERRLATWMEGSSALWAARPEMRGSIYLGLYKLRNSVFGITASSKRQVIPWRYTLNMRAARVLISSAKNEGIGVLLYIPPIRRDVPMPYDGQEYNRFKKDLSQLADEYHVKLVDLENLVPGQLWGSKESTSLRGGGELDFMHFQAGGHKLLAQALYTGITNIIKFQE